MPRMLPEGLGAEIDLGVMDPAGRVFEWLGPRAAYLAEMLSSFKTAGQSAWLLGRGCLSPIRSLSAAIDPRRRERAPIGPVRAGKYCLASAKVGRFFTKRVTILISGGGLTHGSGLRKQ